MKATLQMKDARTPKNSDAGDIFTLEDKKKYVYPTAQKPREGYCFEVNPEGINQKLFEEERVDSKQESTRQLILEAFEELRKNPERNKKFKTFIPEKKWSGYKTVTILKQMSRELGGHMSDWVEQALEWAQRIENGETWEDICNKADTANWFRIVVWKNGHARIVGGSCFISRQISPSHVDIADYYNYNGMEYAVPSISIYE